jgi:PhnB protein
LGLSAGRREVQMDLERQMWGDLFGQCTDLFSVRWMLNIASG